ncbi:MAG TPA: cytochrome c biogenesis protein CcsA [Longilinea sp.]|nr:cytochrome c biogenesis protein CcsA [Longilinea sp.]
MPHTRRGLIALDILAVLGILFAFVIVIWFTPVEATMGAVQKIFYFHVSAGWVGMISFLGAAVASGIYLSTRKTIWDALAVSLVEIGMVFAIINVLSGMIWARPIWNTWWTWDPRLTTTAIMLLVYAAYWILRSAIDDNERKAAFGAVYTIVGFISVPVTFFSIRLYRTIHPLVFGSDNSGMALTPRMQTAFFISLAAFTLVFLALVWHRWKIEVNAQAANETEGMA